MGVQNLPKLSHEQAKRLYYSTTKPVASETVTYGSKQYSYRIMKHRSAGKDYFSCICAVGKHVQSKGTFPTQAAAEKALQIITRQKKLRSQKLQQEVIPVLIEL